jgi:putative phosphoribosyl transferase
MLLDRIGNKFQVKLKDRAAAASILGDALKDVIRSEKERKENTVILGIPRGGTIIADIIARKLSCEFDIIIPRKLRSPHNEEVAIGAIMEDGTSYLNEVLVRELDVSPKYIEEEKTRQMEEIQRRTLSYRLGTSFDYKNLDLNGKNIVLADDGAATGATIIAASRWIRATQSPRSFIIAIPVAPIDTLNLLKREAPDHIEVIITPSESRFKSVGQYYQSFEPVTDKEVIDIMQKSKNKKGV